MALVVNRDRKEGRIKMTGNELNPDAGKTQPQELLEEVIGITHQNQPEFPTLEEQQEYWRKKDEEENRAEVAPDKNECLTCNRKFKSPQALRMHVARTHTKTILTVGQKRKLKRVAGLPQNPTGLREVTPDNPSAFGHPVGSLFIHRRKWSLARRRAFNRKKRAQIWATKADAPSDGTNWTPVPPPKQEEEPVTMIRFCPHCGKGLERFMA